MTVIVVMGVSGSGKTTIGTALANALDVEYAEADTFHPQANIDKMTAGHPLTDEDRAPWPGHDTRLISATVVAIAVIVVLITKVKLHPFLSLVLGSLVLGLAAGMPIANLIKSFSGGVGSTVASVGILIALGAMLGKLLA